ncbi:MAG TPA: endonuclease/exonuclease/phosphatase family protein [Parafilimonas sp.]|nr:endonuclease/exonuclease/phosphatase family protein [Parafilimonas sp.]
MRLLKFLLLTLLSANCLLAKAQKPLQVMTFNIRLNVASDSLNAWPYRKDIAASQVKFFDVDVLGVQEALYDQMTDLKERLPKYKYAGVGREDGKTKGEFSAIFYDTTRLKCLKDATFWLSQTPDAAGSKGWDAALPRIVTWCFFEDKASHKKFYAFNTHFDHMGQVARAESAKLLLKKAKEIAGDLPVIVTGDFNAAADDEPIKIIVDKNNPDHLIETKEISQMPHYGPDGTFNAFQAKEVSNKAIDHIFIKGRLTVLKHASISESWNGRFSSDHFPVLAVISF